MSMLKRSALYSGHTIGTGVYDILRKEILNLQRKPGEPIDSNQLATDLSVSRAPVRDALIRLQSEGLVDIFPQRGTYVSRISLKRVDEECFLRKSLELSVVPLFFKKFNPNVTQLFNKYISRQKKALEEGDNVRLQMTDDAFHGILFHVAEMEMCWNIIQSESGHYQRIRLLSLWVQGISANVVEEHEKLLDAVLSRDAELLLTLLRSHLSNLVNQEQSLLQQYPEYFDNYIFDHF